MHADVGRAAIEIDGRRGFGSGGGAAGERFGYWTTVDQNSIPYFYSLRLSDSAISTGIGIRTLAKPHRPTCKCGKQADLLHDEVCGKVAQAARHNHIRDIVAKFLRQRPSTDVITEPHSSEGRRRNDIGVRGPGRTGRRDLDYEVKVYSPKSVYASDAGLGRRRRAGDTDPVLFHRTQFNEFLAAVDKMAEADKPDSRVEFKPLVFSTGGMMGENTTKEFDQWKKEMGIGYPRLMTAISISLLTARTIHRNACRLLGSRDESE